MCRPALVRDVIVVLPSIEAIPWSSSRPRADGGWLIQRTRRNGAELAVHAPTPVAVLPFAAAHAARTTAPLAPMVFSWLAGRGATRDAARSARRADDQARIELRRCCGRRCLQSERLFTERLVVR